MNKMMAYCGLDCSSCQIHLATLEKDDSVRQAMRISIARECNENYGMNLQPGDINDCDGCRADTGRLFNACRQCKIRECVMEKELETCASCVDYACDNLLAMFQMDPGAKGRLDQIRNA